MDWILNWIWQGCSLAGVVWLGLRWCRVASAATRHTIWGLALALVVILPLVPRLFDATALAPAWVTDGPMLEVAAQPSRVVLTLGLVWCVISLGLLARVARAALHLRQVKASVIPFPAAREAHLAGWCSLRASGRPATLATSPLVRSPGTFGLGTAVIALPHRLVSQLTDEELDRIVVHEYAHVRRRDDIGCALQALIRALLWWHPGVWFIDRALGLEREVACDDWVVHVTGAPRRYAACLTTLAGLTSPHTMPMAPAALSPASQLTVRVTRLLDPRQNRNPRGSAPAVFAAAPALVLAALAMTALGPAVIAEAETGIVRLIGSRAPASGTGLLWKLSPGVEPVTLTSVPRAIRRSSAARATGEESLALPPGPTRAVRGADDARVAAAAPPPLLDADGLSDGLTALVAAPSPAVTSIAATATDLAGSNPWHNAGAAGLAIGNGSRRAATATAGFFTRAGRSIAGAF